MCALDPTAHLFYFEHDYFIKYLNDMGFKLIETYPIIAKNTFNKKGIFRLIFSFSF